jgi:transglutaminase-like putative cysteine protease
MPIKNLNLMFPAKSEGLIWQLCESLSEKGGAGVRNYLLFVCTLLILIFSQISTANAAMYHMKYSFENIYNRTDLWFPIPRYWDGKGTKNIEILSIEPKPDDRYYEPNGNGFEIVYWKAEPQLTYSIEFIVELSKINLDLDFDREWPNYDTSTDLYKKHTAPAMAVQSDNKEIIAKAKEIVGNETNPLKMAQMLIEWMESIRGPENQHEQSQDADALTTLRNGYGGCTGQSNLFVAMCRALGIPARNVGGMHPFPYGDLHFPEGTWDVPGWGKAEGFGVHVWAEFYLEGFGWVPLDPAAYGVLGVIPGEHMIFSKGNDIILDDDNFCDREDEHNAFGKEFSWMYGAHTPCQDFYHLFLEVKMLPPLDIKANGSDGPITVNSSDTVSIEISLDPDNHAGENADWWIAVNTPFNPPGNWYTFVNGKGWSPGIEPFTQTGLTELFVSEVLNMPLPVGRYFFYFAIDDPDGKPTGPWWMIDSVEVNVE